MAADVDATVAKWREWIEGPIRTDVVGMHFKRQIWREIAKIMDANPGVGELPSAFWDFYQETYAAAQAIAIRRQADTDKRTCSLARLITEMRDSAHLLTREDYIGLLGDRPSDGMKERMESGFSGLAGGGDHLDPQIAEADLAELKSAAEQVRNYVNEHVAHDQAQPSVADLPTFGELHETIDAIGKIFQKYGVILTGAWNELEAVIQDDWKAIFRVAWIPS
jgi:AbiU2